MLGDASSDHSFRIKQYLAHMKYPIARAMGTWGERLFMAGVGSSRDQENV